MVSDFKFPFKLILPNALVFTSTFPSSALGQASVSPHRVNYPSQDVYMHIPEWRNQSMFTGISKPELLEGWESRHQYAVEE